MKISTRTLILAAEFAAIIAVLSQFVLPIGLIPLTGQTFAIGLAVTILGMRTGTLSILIYLGLGLIGLPVFAGMKGGIGVLFGPTGGFLVGFIFTGILTGWLLEKYGFSYVSAIIANSLGALVTLLFGTLWLMLMTKLPVTNAFAAGFIPFIIPGIVKAIAASYLGILIRNRITKVVNRPA